MADQQPNQTSQNQNPVNPTSPDVSQQAVAPVAPAPQPSVVEKAEATMQQAQQTTQAVADGAQKMAQQAQQVGADAQKVGVEAQKMAGQAKDVLEQATQMLVGKAGDQPKVTSDEKLWAALSYIPMIALLSLIIKPRSEYVKLHGRQGLVLFIIFFLSIFLYIVIPPLGPLLGGLIQLGIFVLGIYSILQAFVGNWWKIPIIGDLAKMIPAEAFAKVTTEALTGQPMSNAQDQTQAPDQANTNPTNQETK